jgi:hypothetical protein
LCCWIWIQSWNPQMRLEEGHSWEIHISEIRGGLYFQLALIWVFKNLFNEHGTFFFKKTHMVGTLSFPFLHSGTVGGGPWWPCYISWPYL